MSEYGRGTEWSRGWRADFRRTLERDMINPRFSVTVRALSRRLVEAINMIDRLENATPEMEKRAASTTEPR